MTNKHSVISMRTHTLSIRAFPYEVNKALKRKAVDQDIHFRTLVIRILTEASKPAKEQPRTKGEGQ
jgi:hypothetical protein